jgi:imidazolonepropionase-like amidohydrolase
MKTAFKNDLRLLVSSTLFFLFFSLQSAGYGQNIELRNVNYFNGEGFEKGTLFIESGVFSNTKPLELDSILDLKNRFMIPALTEAHTHAFASTYQLQKEVGRYLSKGILNVQVLGGAQSGREQAEEVIKSTNLEVRYSNGGITSTLGHPFTIYEPLAMGIHNPVEKRKRAKEIRDSRLAEGDAYWFFDTKEEVERRWDTLMATEPDVIKFMLLNVDEYERLSNDSTMLGGKGVSKEVAKAIIEKAHRDQKKVFAHVETANDFKFAVQIGVDVIAHMPGYAYSGKPEDRDQYMPEEATLRMAAEKGTAVVTTAGLSQGYAKEYQEGVPVLNEDRFQEIVRFQKELITKMMNANIRILIGSDQYGKTLLEEVKHLETYNLIPNDDILRIITNENAEEIFPNRKIGKIQHGYEADFILLNANPLAQLDILESPIAVYKSGIRIYRAE